MKIDEYIQQTPNCKITMKKGLLGTHYTFLPTGSPMRCYHRYVKGEDRQRICEALNHGKVNILSSVEPQVSTNTLLTILLAKDASSALIQLSEYIPHDFVPATEPLLVTNEEVTLVKTFVK